MDEDWAGHEVRHETATREGGGERPLGGRDVLNVNRKQISLLRALDEDRSGKGMDAT